MGATRLQVKAAPAPSSSADFAANWQQIGMAERPACIAGAGQLRFLVGVIARNQSRQAARLERGASQV